MAGTPDDEVGVGACVAATDAWEVVAVGAVVAEADDELDGGCAGLAAVDALVLAPVEVDGAGVIAVVVAVGLAVAVAEALGVPAVGAGELGVAGAGGAGAPGTWGSIDAPWPVTSAPFLGVMATKAGASGAWMLPRAALRSPAGPAARYPTAPGGGRTNPIAPASCSIRWSSASWATLPRSCSFCAVSVVVCSNARPMLAPSFRIST